MNHFGNIISSLFFPFFLYFLVFLLKDQSHHHVGLLFSSSCLYYWNSLKNQVQNQNLLKDHP